MQCHNTVQTSFLRCESSHGEFIGAMFVGVIHERSPMVIANVAQA